MKPSKLHHPGDLQPRILNLLWRREEASVADVHSALAQERLTYTIIATMLRKMEARGQVAYRVEGRTSLCRAAVVAEHACQGMADHVVDRLFEGSLAGVVAIGGRALGSQVLLAWMAARTSRPSDAETSERIAQLASALGFRWRARLVESGPVVRTIPFGVLRPTIGSADDLFTRHPNAEQGVRLGAGGSEPVPTRRRAPSLSSRFP